MSVLDTERDISHSRVNSVFILPGFLLLIIIVCIIYKSKRLVQVKQLERIRCNIIRE